MKQKLLILLACSFLSVNLFAQDSSRVRKTREYYITFTDFSPFTVALKYKCQLKNNTFFKIGLIDLSAATSSQRRDNSASFPVNTNRYSAGLEIGIEFRKPINNRFTIYHGPNIGYSYIRTENRDMNPAIPQANQKTWSEIHRASIPYTIGLLFNITPNILVAAEINPMLQYVFATNYMGTSTPRTSTNQASFDLNNRFGILSLVYRP